MGLAVLFDIREVTTITYGRDGKATMVQVGSSGIALDPGTATRAPSFTWYGGIVLTQGRLDRTFLFSDVTRQRRAGIEGRHLRDPRLGPEDPPLSALSGAARPGGSCRSAYAAAPAAAPGRAAPCAGRSCGSRAP